MMFRKKYIPEICSEGIKELSMTEKKPGKIFVSILVLVSALFSIAHFMSAKMTAVNKGIYDLSRIPQGFLIFGGGLLAAYYAVMWYQRHVTEHPVRLSDRALFCAVFIPLTAVGIFWLLVYYPGVGMYDTISVIADSGYRIASQHPWFYCFLIKCLIKVVFLFGGDYEAVLVSEGILQVLISAALCSYCIVWLRRKGLSRLPVTVISLYLIFDPMLNMYRVALFKDLLYAYLLILWMLLLYDIWESRGEALQNIRTMVYISILLIFSLVRNNGTYVSAFILICMLIAFRKQWRRLAVLAGVLILVMGGSSLFQKAHSVQHLFKETIGIPLQQVAAAVTADGPIDDEDLRFIDEALPVDFIKEHYDPYNADRLKWGGAPINNQFLNSHKVEFLKVWLHMLPENFRTYVSAYLRATYGFWATGSEGIKRYDTIYVEALSSWFEENRIDIQCIFPEPLQQKLFTLTYDSTMTALSEGQLFWLFIFAMCLLMLFNRKSICLIAAPAIGCWLTLMISTPIAHQWRYTLYFAIMAPVILGLTIAKEPEKSI